MKALLIITACILLQGCSTQLATQEKFNRIAYGLGQQAPHTPTHIVGNPYYKNGRLYRPRHQPSYNAIGTATWYGKDYTGNKTANGERADAQNLFAAHRTLPLPSYVEVKNLENGRLLTVRVNERGPFHTKSIIAVSQRAAELLGFKHKDQTRIHIRYLSPAPIQHVGRNH